MANLITGGVINGLISASANMKSAQISASVYQSAKNRKDDAGMERALGYMTDYAKEAKNAVQKSNEALLESTQNIHQPEHVEKTPDVNAAIREQNATNDDKLMKEIEAANNQILNPVDTVEISPESVTALQNEQAAAVQVEEESTLQATAVEEEQQIAPVEEEEDTARQSEPEQNNIQQLLASAQNIYAQQNMENDGTQPFAMDVAV